MKTALTRLATVGRDRDRPADRGLYGFVADRPHRLAGPDDDRCLRSAGRSRQAVGTGGNLPARWGTRVKSLPPGHGHRPPWQALALDAQKDARRGRATHSNLPDSRGGTE